MTLPRLTVCIPAYNGAAYVGDAIRSVLDQTFADYVLWVVDDCSTDATVDVVERINDPRVHLIRNPRNLGLIGNWNRCTEVAGGEFLLLLHQDDVLGPGFMTDVVAFFDEHPEAGIVSTGGRPIDSGGSTNHSVRFLNPRYRNRTREARVLPAGDESVRYLLTYGATISGIVVRRSVYDVVGTFDAAFPYSADEEMWTRIAQRHALGLLPGTLVFQRNHAGQFRSETWKRPDFLKQYLAVQSRRVSYLKSTSGFDPALLVARAGSSIAFRLIAAGDFSGARRFLESAEALFPAIARDPRHFIARLFCRVPRLGQFSCHTLLRLN